MPSKQPEGLISVLQDQSAPFGDRDDAAMDLAAFDEPGALLALESVADDPATDRDLVESCRDSLVEIRQRSAGTG